MRKLIKLQTVSSTHLIALKLLEMNILDEDIIIMAKQQTGGVGRCNRSWISLPNNLFMSMIIRKPQMGNEVSLMIACAVHDTISQIIKSDDRMLTLHWPNDIHYDGKKISGILLATINSWLVISIGMNLRPVEEISTAISLEEICHRGFSPTKVMRQVESSIDKWLQCDFSVVRDYWLANTQNLGQEITIKNGDDSLSGIYKGINESGKLMLDIGNRIVFVSSGDMFEMNKVKYE